MEKLHEEFPMYNWQKNAGYLTAEHLNAIDKYGICKYHRPSFLKKHFEKKETI
jgi:ribonuclease HII